MDVDIYKVLPACLGSISYPIHVRRNELVMVSPVYSLIVDFIIFDECRTKVLAVIQCLGGDDAFVLTDHGNLVPDIPSHQHLVRRAHLLAFVLNVPEIIFFTPTCDAIICLSWCDKRVLNGKDTDFLECTPTLYTSKRTYDDNPKTDNVRMLIFSAVMRSIAYHEVPAHSCWVHKRKNEGEQEASESALQKYARLS
ncbi:hypothetical protein AAP_01783 [Ascosphaera apis ARSEF 7405]|uniref:Uncharacterized protein n=1 Tax=Ascosphaera apis ARSEF 7405 TaxID=392613 RepID=A0A162IJS6_9EURO|nr:hypothetical protein AAP_01783 [Ascosphaera apis ARSEF 7405]